MTFTQTEIMRAELEFQLPGVAKARKDVLAERLVQKGWRNFDSANLVYMPEIARKVGVSMANAHKWWKRHADEVPPPVISIKLGNGATLTAWDADDAQIFVNYYVESRAERAGTARGMRAT